MAERDRGTQSSQPPGWQQAAGCGCLLLVSAVFWLLLFGFGLPRWPSAGLSFPPSGQGWLILSTIVGLLAAVSPFPLLLLTAMTLDGHRGALPRAARFTALFWVLPIMAVMGVVAAWMAFFTGFGVLADLAALMPWLAACGLVALTASLLGAASLRDR